ncbi:MAG: type II toxin-antitoxin system RelE/ParE family toxin [Abditibacteriaceae bacterium]
MAFKVVPTRRAKADIHEIVDYIAQDSVSAANTWFSGLWEFTQGLQEFPYRFALIPENKKLGKTYRCCLYHSHRIVYRVDEINQVVYVVRVYHVARTPLQLSDFD